MTEDFLFLLLIQFSIQCLKIRIRIHFPDTLHGLHHQTLILPVVQILRGIQMDTPGSKSIRPVLPIPVPDIPPLNDLAAMRLYPFSCRIEHPASCISGKRRLFVQDLPQSLCQFLIPFLNRQTVLKCCLCLCQKPPQDCQFSFLRSRSQLLAAADQILKLSAVPLEGWIAYKIDFRCRYIFGIIALCISLGRDSGEPYGLNSISRIKGRCLLIPRGLPDACRHIRKGFSVFAYTDPVLQDRTVPVLICSRCITKLINPLHGQSILPFQCDGLGQLLPVAPGGMPDRGGTPIRYLIRFIPCLIAIRICHQLTLRNPFRPLLFLSI